MHRIFLLSIGLFIIGCSNDNINIYTTEEYQNLSQKDINIGESVWVKTCSKCHMHGAMGAAPIKNKAHFDRIAAKGFDALYKSVLQGMDGPLGMMPPKGNCYTCSEDELKKSVYYIFHLAEQVASQPQQSQKQTQ